MDVLLARKTFPAHAPVAGAASTLGSGHVSINMKGKGLAMEAVMKAMPDARHLFMYRDARKVALIRTMYLFGLVLFFTPCVCLFILSLLASASG